MSKFRKGVLVGDEVTELLNYANEHDFALRMSQRALVVVPGLS